MQEGKSLRKMSDNKYEESSDSGDSEDERNYDLKVDDCVEIIKG